MIFKIYAGTDAGCKRTRNEDGILINNMGCYNSDFCFFNTCIKPPILAFVADGVGGSENGCIATQICITEAMKADIPSDDTELIGMIDAINKNVCEAKQIVDTACTIAGLLITEDTMYCFNIGDSKVFSFSHGFLNQLSIDDTFSGLSGEITADKEPLIQYIGKQTIMPHIDETNSMDGFLICTDGLTDMLSLDEIEAIVESSSDEQELLKELLRKAKINGGEDNVSAIIIKPLKEINNG